MSKVKRTQCQQKVRNRVFCIPTDMIEVLFHICFVNFIHFSYLSFITNSYTYTIPIDDFSAYVS